MPSPRVPLYYTFGNHMHWVDMQWLWGYGVLPGSVVDMLRLIDATGARGNVNFDAVGYEKMAAECPEALDRLRAAVAAGKVEPVGCSYGQPYGLFHGGESNVRQLTYGVRATRRLLGVRARAFWEEEFYFFPQLPQMLAQCGYTGACLFFQWTWHTPEVPREESPLILWEGIDGTRIATLPRGELNLHQWPEDFEGLLERLAARVGRRSAAAGSGESEDDASNSPPRSGGPPGLPPAVVQWLELMPSRDWMCRSEVLLPRLRELMRDERFEVRARTLSGMIDELRQASRDRGIEARVPVRRYSMDDVWHGMTLGKNGDRHPRTSAALEGRLVHAEALASVTGVLGRPYASWDVYPTWELEEGWRLALAAQHHDNHECEGLCGFIGHDQFQHASALAEEVIGRASWLVRARTGSTLPEYNTLGWERRICRDMSHIGYKDEVSVPPFGYAPRPPRRRESGAPLRIRRRDGNVILARQGLSVTVEGTSGLITGIRLDRDPSVGFGGRLRLGELWLGNRKCRGRPRVTVTRPLSGVSVEQPVPGDSDVTRIVSIAPGGDGADLWLLQSPSASSLRPGINNSFQIVFECPFDPRVYAGTPFSAAETRVFEGARRKYPSGDWMTAPQWFEDLDGVLTSCGFLDLVDPRTGTGLLICHEACVQWLRRGRKFRAVVTALDPWDEARYAPGHCSQRPFRIIPHAPLRNVDRARAAMEFAADSSRPYRKWSKPVGGGTGLGVKRDAPRTFGGLDVCGAPNVLAHAFFRESMKSGEHLPEWAGHRMFRESGGACDHPYVVRLVEWDGEPAEVLLKLPGPVAMAAKTNLLGEVLSDAARQPDSETGGWTPADSGWLAVEHPVEPPEWAKGAVLKGKPITWSAVRVPMRPREIATVYADLVMGRKEWRDLDAKREVWATVHRE